MEDLAVTQFQRLGNTTQHPRVSRRGPEGEGRGSERKREGGKVTDGGFYAGVQRSREGQGRREGGRDVRSKEYRNTGGNRGKERERSGEAVCGIKIDEGVGWTCTCGRRTWEMGVSGRG